jgi:hypothetical protein
MERVFRKMCGKSMPSSARTHRSTAARHTQRRRARGARSWPCGARTLQQGRLVFKRRACASCEAAHRSAAIRRLWEAERAAAAAKPAGRRVRSGKRTASAASASLVLSIR